MDTRTNTPAALTKSDWKDVALEVKDNLGTDRVGLVAAGIAFYGLLAIFPAITALMAIGGLLIDPARITAMIERAADVMPEQMSQIILDQARSVTAADSGGLGLAAIIGIAVALYAASKGVAGLIQGMNIAYEEEETRGFVMLTVMKLALTLGLIIGILVAVGVTIILPAFLNIVDLGRGTETLIAVGRWALFGGLTILALGVLYAIAPDRKQPRWQCVSIGAVLACILWVAGSVGFSIYVQNFGKYNESFGTLAGVIILLLWLWISAYIVLLGAELNAAIEARRPTAGRGPR